MSSVEAVKAAIARFHKVQWEQNDYGAGDTEPDGVFQSLLRKAWKGVPVKVPHTASDWQLYSGVKGAAKAARALHAAAKEAVKAIQAVPIGERRELQQLLRGVCWR